MLSGFGHRFNRLACQRSFACLSRKDFRFSAVCFSTWKKSPYAQSSREIEVSDHASTANSEPEFKRSSTNFYAGRKVEVVKRPPLSEMKVTPFTSERLKLFDASRHGDDQQVIDIFKRMVEFGMRPDLVIVNLVMQSYSRRNMLTSAVELYKKMLILQVNPNSITFNYLLKMCAELGNADIADLVVKEMEMRGVALTEYAYNSLAVVFARALRLEDALKAYNALKEKKLRINAHTYYNVIMAAMRLDCNDLVFEAFDDYVGSRSYVSTVLCMDVMERALAGNQAVFAFSVFDQLRVRNVRIRPNILSTLFGMATQEKIFDRALQVMDIMIATRACPGLPAFLVAVESYCESLRLNDLLILVRLVEQADPMNVPNEAINSSASEGEVSASASPITTHVIPVAWISNLAARLAVEQLDESMSWLLDEKEQGRPVTRGQIRLLLHLCATAQAAERGYFFAAEMIDRIGVRPNMNIIIALTELAMLFGSRRTDIISRPWEYVKEFNIRMSPRGLNMLLELYSKKQMVDIALEIYQAFTDLSYGFWTSSLSEFALALVRTNNPQYEPVLREIITALKPLPIPSLYMAKLQAAFPDVYFRERSPHDVPEHVALPRGLRMDGVMEDDSDEKIDNW
eukprot:GILK01007729.1.p1 GENE.GILK01007729.1~~GILK01007729.1.p1  ORF type:complete len:628 (-),score=72.29 GILK01007729.1:120-2003(-)